jgi:hypothetical protein
MGEGEHCAHVAGGVNRALATSLHEGALALALAFSVFFSGLLAARCLHLHPSRRW